MHATSALTYIAIVQVYTPTILAARRPQCTAHLRSPTSLLSRSIRRLFLPLVDRNARHICAHLHRYCPGLYADYSFRSSTVMPATSALTYIAIVQVYTPTILSAPRPPCTPHLRSPTSLLSRSIRRLFLPLVDRNARHICAHLHRYCPGLYADYSCRSSTAMHGTSALTYIAIVQV